MFHGMADFKTLWIVGVLSSILSGYLVLCGRDHSLKNSSRPNKPNSGKLKELKKRANSKNDSRNSLKAHDPSDDFQKRPMVSIPGANPGDGLKLTIMTYNVLAQALVNRKQFPESGQILRWGLRFKVIKEEITHYQPTVMCLQEVDAAKIAEWNAFLLTLKYTSYVFRQVAKKHCLIIALKSDILRGIDQMNGEYDSVPSQHAFRNYTNNSYMLLKCHFTTEVTSKFPYLLDRGVIIGNTHLYWHPLGCFDRARQANILLNAIGEWTRKSEATSTFKYSSFIAGDFNSEPFDAPYQLMTDKKLIRDEALTLKLRNSYENHTMLGNCDNTRSSSSITSEATFAVSNLTDCRFSLPYNVESLYSLAYHLVCTDGTNVCNEPQFSNWTPQFRGTLDYIFVLSRRSSPMISSNENRLDDHLNFSDFELNGMKLLKLLLLPTRQQMKVPGLPRAGWGPSDHLPIMAELELLAL